MKVKTVRVSQMVICLCMLFSATAFAAPESRTDTAGKTVQEFVKRGGLDNFYRKIKQGDSVKVAYLGGSITAQPGWRILSLGWMKQRFPKAHFSEINAAIGGTGSDFGVFRLPDDVLQYHPDLVLVEFAVNDDGAPTEKVTRSMEGIVRRLWQQDPYTDICFIYTIKQDFLKTEQGGRLPASALAMERVAGYYHIPSINFGNAVCKEVSKNQLIFKGPSRDQNGVRVFSPDGVHPYPETGHVIYQGVFKRSFESMVPTRRLAPEKHSLPRPLAPDYFSQAHMIGLSQTALSPDWQILSVDSLPELASFGHRGMIVGRADQSGETLTVRFKGRAIGAFDIIGPGSGRVIVKIDGGVPDTIRRFDAYCTYWRPSYFLIDHLTNTAHVVTFTTLGAPFDKARILAQRGNIIKDTTILAKNNWYVNRILIDGTTD